MPRNHLVTSASIYTVRPVITRHRVRIIGETPPSNSGHSLIYYVLMSVALLLWLPPLLAGGRMIFGTAPPAEKMPCILISCAILFVAGTLIGNFALRFAPCR